MKFTTTLIAFLILGLITACSTTVNKAVKIKSGDSREQVLAIMGDPDDRQFNGKDEAWQYAASRAGYAEYRIIWFNEGIVFAVTSYRQSGATAMGGLREINWESKPDRTIEIRNR